ncbi:MAG: hypothetical protein RXR43_12530 [Sulfolobus sp.]
MNPSFIGSQYYVTDDISIIPRLEREINVNEEVEVDKELPINTASVIASSICGKSIQASVTYSIERPMKKILQSLGFISRKDRELQYNGIYGTPDIITLNGDIAELKAVHGNADLCKGLMQSTIYSILKVMSDVKKYGDRIRYPRLYLILGYHDNINYPKGTTTLEKMEIYSVNIKIKGLGLPNNVITLYRAGYLIQSLLRARQEVRPAIPVIM